MTMQQESDLHASIRRLAEMEWECPIYVSHNLGSRHLHQEDGRHAAICLCQGTGRIVLFPALQIPCRNSIRPLLALEGEPDDPVAEQRHQELFHRERCPCEGKYWFPEPDVEKACWRVMLCLRDMDRHTTILSTFLNGGVQTRDAVLRAAEAWAKEQVKARGVEP